MQDYKVSPFLVGTMRIGSWGACMNQSQIEEFIEGCIGLKLIDFDHADIYGSYTTELEFGSVLKSRPDLRSKMRITTKCGIKLVSEHRPLHKIKSYDLSRGHIISSVENSLVNLNTDYLDTLLLHRPDYLFDAHEIAEAFTDLKKAGKVRYFGVSNFSTAQFDLLNSFTPLCTNQIEISLLQREAFENGLLNQCQKLGIAPTAWSPLGGGVLFKPKGDPKIERILKAIHVLTAKYDADIDQILLAWLRKHPSGIVPVLGTSKISRIQKAKESLSIDLTHEEWYMLWEAAIGKEVD